MMQHCLLTCRGWGDGPTKVPIGRTFGSVTPHFPARPLWNERDRRHRLGGPVLVERGRPGVWLPGSLHVGATSSRTVESTRREGPRDNPAIGLHRRHDSPT